MHARKVAADLTIQNMGITFTVYSDGGNIDRVWPFDIIPRVMSLRAMRAQQSTRESVRTAGWLNRLQPVGLNR